MRLRAAPTSADEFTSRRAACIGAPDERLKGMALGVIILTGGASSRMGSDKAVLDWNGRRAVDRLAELARNLGAAGVVTAGAGSYGLPVVVEDPPGSGPAAGILAAAATLRPACARVLVLAVDAPTIVAADLTPLLHAPFPGAFFEGLNLPLVADLAALPGEDAGGWSIRRLIQAAGLTSVTCPAGPLDRLRGANSPEERIALLNALVQAEGAQKGGAG